MYNLINVIALDDVDDRLMLVYDRKDSDQNFRTNVIVAAFITSYARIRLYRLLVSYKFVRAFVITVKT